MLYKKEQVCACWLWDYLFGCINVCMFTSKVVCLCVLGACIEPVNGCACGWYDFLYQE